MIKKLIIPAAGYGTRFLPATKAIPKPLLPVLNKPALQWVVEEAIASGIQEIICVIMPEHKAIKEHFSYNPKLAAHLRKFNKTDLLKNFPKIKINFIEQKHFYGTAYPVLECEKLINNQAFAVVWSDEIDSGKVPRLKQLIKAFNKYQDPVIAVYKIDDEGTRKYGIIKGKKISQNIYQVQELLEKPGPEKAPSRLGSRGGYILTPDIFEILKRLKKQIKKGQEFYLTDAIHELAKQRPIYAKLIKNKLYDTGNVLDWLKANLELGRKYLNAKT
ncbi:MAG: sugar phosphate nucleotidyltransferase [bacterium]